jgi:hypothetical protein
MMYMQRIRKAQKAATAYTDQNLAWLLVFMGAMYQVSFCLPWASSHSSMLYITLAAIHPMLPVWWAAPGVIALVLLLIGIFKGHHNLLRIAAGVQVVLWTFAFLVYMMAGIYFLAMAIAFTQMAFWSWNFTVRDIEKD